MHIILEIFHKLLSLVLPSMAVGAMLFIVYRRFKHLTVIALIICALALYIYADYNKLSTIFFVLSYIIGIGFSFTCLKISSNNSEANKCVVPLISSNNKHYKIENSNLGVFISGASGAGKSCGPIFQLAKHFAENDFAGIINDYKDYELTDILYPLFKNGNVSLHVFALHDLSRSIRINPISPKYLKTDLDILNIVSVLTTNLSQSDDNTGVEKFFYEGTKSLLCGLISRLKDTFPNDCNLPTVIAILLGPTSLDEKDVPFGKLARFLNNGIHSATLASAFLHGIGNMKQTASLMSTVATHLSKICTPEIFYLLSDDDVDLNINAQESRSVISFINNPKQSEAFSPIIATMIEVCLTQMSVRGRDHSFVLLDEAPTIKLMGLGEKTRTLRSFNIHFVYGIQDKIAGITQFSGKAYKYKEIITNLSTQFFGKVNDPETAADYEKYFELIDITSKSYSRGGGSGERVTISKREVSKHRSHDFFRLKQGEFVMFSGGKDTKFRFKYYNSPQERPPVIRNISQQDIDAHYRKIFDRATSIIQTF